MLASAAAHGAPSGVRIESRRFALARLASHTAVGVDGVLATDAGPHDRWVTVDHDQRLPGVLCIATASGGYDISLRLRCALVPLMAVGAAVAGAVRDAAESEGHRVDDLRIEIVDVVEPSDQ